MLRWLGRLLFPLLADVQINGRENLPIKGPAILAGNHAAILEAVLLAIYSPAAVEFLGTGDIPIDPRYSWLANLYGFIPIKRGSVDRAAIYSALSVLKQDGVVGIFPQGGIWGAAATQGRTGVALLGSLSAAPVVPIGFGGVRGGLQKMLKFKHPCLIMNVGKPFQLVAAQGKQPNSKDRLEADAVRVMAEIEKLIPLGEIEKETRRDEWFDVVIEISAEPRTPLDGISAEERQALGKFFHYPVLLDALARNIKLPVTCLQRFGEPNPASEIRTAITAILDYLERINPGFFTYRFGMEVGLAVQQALKAVLNRLSDAGNLNLHLAITPLYGYTDGQGNRLKFSGGESLHPDY